MLLIGNSWMTSVSRVTLNVRCTHSVMDLGFRDGQEGVSNARGAAQWQNMCLVCTLRLWHLPRVAEGKVMGSPPRSWVTDRQVSEGCLALA